MSTEHSVSLKLKELQVLRPVEDQILIAIQEENIAMTYQLIQKAIAIPDFNSRFILRQAIDCNNLELVCMILYYFPYSYFGDNWTCSTPFRYSIIKKRSSSIQRILLDYEDLNVIHERSTLLLAMQFKSPIISELLERDIPVEPYYDFCAYNNIVIHAMEVDVHIEAVKILWDKFDYLAWKQYSSHSILSSFIRNYTYLPVLMENEDKLQIVIEHYEQAYMKSFVGELYINKMKRIIFFDEDEIEGEVLHFLSYGAKIFTSDLDCMYYYSSNPTREFFRLLLFMDLRPSSIIKISPMYFKYTLVPNLDTFLDAACKEIIGGRSNLKTISTIIQEVGRLYSFVTYTSRIFRSIPFFALNSKEEYTYYYKKIFLLTNHFPSLKQLARDALRLAIIKHYKIKNSSQLFTRIDHFSLLNSIKDSLVLDVEMYPMNNFSMVCDGSEAVQDSFDFEV